MRLIERVCEENLLNPQVLCFSKREFPVKSDMGQVQRLSKMNLLDEDSLLKLFSSRYGIPMLSEASQVVKTRPEVDQVKPFLKPLRSSPFFQKQGWRAAWNQFKLARYLKNRISLRGRPRLVSCIPGSDQQSPGKRRTPSMKNRRKPFPR